MSATGRKQTSAAIVRNGWGADIDLEAVLPSYATWMKCIASSALFFAIAGCAPPYVWGDADRVEDRLVVMVPLGSSPALLKATAKSRGWDINHRNVRSWPAGSKTYMDDTHLSCRSRGGLAVPSIIAHYSAPFETYVESLWLFDPQNRLRDICVRKTVDAL